MATPYDTPAHTPESEEPQNGIDDTNFAGSRVTPLVGRKHSRSSQELVIPGYDTHGPMDYSSNTDLLLDPVNILNMVTKEIGQCL